VVPAAFVAGPGGQGVDLGEGLEEGLGEGLSEGMGEGLKIGLGEGAGGLGE
jgi:hypothetical protein